MKWFFVLSAVMIIVLLHTGTVSGAEVSIGGTLEETQLGEIENIAADKYDINLKELIGNAISGNMDWAGLGDKILSLMFSELIKNKEIIKNILFICLLNGIIVSLTDGVIKSGAEQSAYFAAYAAIAGMLAAGFRICANTVVSAAGEITELMRAGMPLILCIVTAGSGGGAALSFAGVLSITVGIIDTLIKDVIIPQITFAVMLGILNCLWERTMVGKLSELFAFLAVWEVRICAFVFLGCLGIGRMGAVPASAAVGKGLKLAVGAVPVVGGLFENSLESVSVFVGMLKGGAAAAIVIVIAAAAFTGLIKLCGVMLMYKLTAALCEPLGSKRITELIDCAAEGIKLLLGTYFTVAVMFAVAVCVMLGSFG